MKRNGMERIRQRNGTEGQGGGKRKGAGFPRKGKLCTPILIQIYIYIYIYRGNNEAAQRGNQ